MDRSMPEQWAIPEGADVYGAEGDKIGKIVAVHPTYVVVEKGFFFPTDYQIPRAAIATVDGDDVYLAVTKDQALNQQWGDGVPADYLHTEPADATTTTTTTTATEGYPATGTTGAAGTAGYETEAGVAHQTEGDVAHVEGTDTLRVPVYEEELTATTRPTELGDVQIRKDVVEEEQAFEVPVTEERVRVTRRAVDRAAGAGEGAFEEGTIEVPIRGEQVDVQKRTRVAEELEVAKEQVQRTERVGGTVRKERVHVDEDATLTAEERAKRTDWTEPATDEGLGRNR
jgi:uncharacterized protein (TIGR02271 family)